MNRASDWLLLNHPHVYNLLGEPALEMADSFTCLDSAIQDAGEDIVDWSCHQDWKPTTEPEVGRYLVDEDENTHIVTAIDGWFVHTAQAFRKNTITQRLGYDKARKFRRWSIELAEEEHRQQEAEIRAETAIPQHLVW